jgi:hypothetical protein
MKFKNFRWVSFAIILFLTSVAVKSQPFILNLTMSPSDLYPGSNVTCSGVMNTSEAWPGNYTNSWTVNGNSSFSPIFDRVANHGDVINSSLETDFPGYYLKEGDSIRCKMCTWDGVAYLCTLEVAEVQKATSPPTQPGGGGGVPPPPLNEFIKMVQEGAMLRDTLRVYNPGVYDQLVEALDNYLYPTPVPQLFQKTCHLIGLIIKYIMRQPAVLTPQVV